MSARPPRYRAYSRWAAMIRRCTVPTDREWKWYGARGITVCAEWLNSFDVYYAALGDPPFPGATVDRIDNDGSYEPSNVRWATYGQQKLNSRDPNRLKTHCVHGHEFTEENTYRPSAGNRMCRECGRQRKRRGTSERTVEQIAAAVAAIQS